MSFTILSIHLAFGLPTGLLPGTFIYMTFLTSLSSFILLTCPYHCNLISLAFSLMSLTPSSLLMLTLLILSLRVTPFISLSICVLIVSRRRN